MDSGGGVEAMLMVHSRRRRSTNSTSAARNPLLLLEMHRRKASSKSNDIWPCDCDVGTFDDFDNDCEISRFQKWFLRRPRIHSKRRARHPALAGTWNLQNQHTIRVFAFELTSDVVRGCRIDTRSMLLRQMCERTPVSHIAVLMSHFSS